MIIVLDPAEADAKLAAAELACAGCGTPLRPWGSSWPRTVRGQDGPPVVVSPRRVRCRPCGVTHVLLPAELVPRRSATAEVIGAALLASTSGVGYRRIGADLSLPADTVRGWVRRATANAEFLRRQGTITAHEFDSELPPTAPPGRGALADAIDALGLVVAAVVRRIGPVLSPWRIVSMITGGQLLAPHPKPA